MKLPNLTPRQQTILILLYKYRFLNRIQIQTLMGHKDYKRINAWLADLRDNHYVEWIYSTDFLEKSKPGIYYLGLNGIRWLKEHQGHPIEELRKRYRESSRSQGFVDQCMLVTDCCITMNTKNTDDSGRSRIHYLYATQADYLDPESDYHFLSESNLIRPSWCSKRLLRPRTTSRVLPASLKSSKPPCLVTECESGSRTTLNTWKMGIGRTRQTQSSCLFARH